MFVFYPVLPLVFEALIKTRDTHAQMMPCAEERMLKLTPTRMFANCITHVIGEANDNMIRPSIDGFLCLQHGFMD